MNKIPDLKFVIGAILIIAGLLLLRQVGQDAGQWNLNKAVGWGYEDHSSIMLWCGIIFITFGVIMILLSFIKRRHKLKKQ
jgi:formate-dependent nitrite reductase membrane component NrfD